MRPFIKTSPQVIKMSYRNFPYTVKRLAIFPSPAGMPLTKLSLARNNLSIPGQGEFG
jgi:hypothetical protein